MKLKDCLELVNTLTQCGIDKNIFEAQETDRAAQTEVSNKPLKLLIAAANLVLSELAEEYCPLVAKQTVDCYGVIDYAAFEHKVLAVYRIADANKIKYSFRYTPSGVECAARGQLDVVYSYAPDECGFWDDVKVGSSVITQRIICYGIAREYCLLCLRQEEAAVWDARYQDALRSVLPKRCEQRVKARAFL